MVFSFMTLKQKKMPHIQSFCCILMATNQFKQIFNVTEWYIDSHKPSLHEFAIFSSFHRLKLN